MSGRQNDWNEKTRVQLPAVIHVGRLGWKYRTKDQLKWAQHPMRISLSIFAQALSRINGRDVEIAEARKIANAIETICDKSDLGEHFSAWLHDPKQAPQGLYENDEELENQAN